MQILCKCDPPFGPYGILKQPSPSRLPWTLHPTHCMDSHMHIRAHAYSHVYLIILYKVCFDISRSHCISILSGNSISLALFSMWKIWLSFTSPQKISKNMSYSFEKICIHSPLELGTFLSKRQLVTEVYKATNPQPYTSIHNKIISPQNSKLWLKI